MKEFNGNENVEQSGTMMNSKEINALVNSLGSGADSTLRDLIML